MIEANQRMEGEDSNTSNCDCDNEDIKNHAIGTEKTYKAKKEVVRV